VAAPIPTPTALKILRGNPGKRRLNREEPQSLPTDATPPADLPAAAVAIWEERVPELIRMGVMTLALADRGEIAKACRLDALGLARLEQAPSWALNAMRDATRIWARFGVGASDRSRITTAHPKKPESRWAGLIGGKPA